MTQRTTWKTTYEVTRLFDNLSTGNRHAIEEKKEGKNKRINNTGRFEPPDVETVRAYCQERGNKVDPQAFVDFYESKGWMVGKNKMKNWKAAVRTWEKEDQRRSQTRKEETAKRAALDLIISLDVIMTWTRWKERF